MQLHAGYISSTISRELYALKKEESKLKLEGLLQSLCVFDVHGNINAEINENPNPYLSVLYNAVSRGIPTLLSHHLESIFANKLEFTTDISDEFVFNFDLKPKFKLKNYFELLHPADSRYTDRNNFLNISFAESNFEKAFLTSYLPQELSFLFDQQRARNTLGADRNNQGRVDFSLEIPYFGIEQRTNRFNQQVKVKTRKKFIVEVDGARYHEDLIDDLKDHEIAQFRHDIHHVKEASSFNDSNELIEKLNAEQYIKQTLKNLSLPIENKIDELQFVFSPIGIARLQKTILHLLLQNPELTELKIAVIERDVPCAALAIEDLKAAMNHLSNLSVDFFVPEISLKVFTSEAFYNADLHDGNQSVINQNFNPSEYDFVLDIALLNKSFTVNYPNTFEYKNVLKIRNSHFEDSSFTNRLISSQAIKYRDLVNQIGNEQYEPVESTVENIEYFIQYFFRKKSFRDGQLPIINRALSQKSVIGLLPTGGGKSLTYQLVSLLQPGCTIVVDPIKSLMFDQFKSLREIGITRATFINSSLTASERNYATRGLEHGYYQFVFISPERYVIEKFREALSNATKNNNYFAYVVIDEVHCVSEWGHDFRTPYLDLGENAIKYTHTKSGASIPLIGLTATASFDVLADIERELRIKDDDGNAIIRFENTVRDEVNYKIVRNSANFEGISLHSRFIRNHIGDSKSTQLAHWLQNVTNELERVNKKDFIDSITTQSYDNFLPGYLKSKESSNNGKIKFPNYDSYRKHQLRQLKIDEINWKKSDGQYAMGAVIFCPHKSGSHGVTALVDKLGTELPEIETGYFVGGNEGDVEETSFINQERFINSDLGIMVATKAFGMGIDKSNVRITAHINIPQSIESFVQEAGRAGRDKKMSLSYIMLNDQIQEIYKNDDEKSKELVPFWSDHEILLYFHNNSFKGKLKERQTLFELRSVITFPSSSRINLLQQQVNELLEVDFLTLKFGRGASQYKIYINDSEKGDSLGFYNLENEQIGKYPYLDPLLQNKALELTLSLINQINISGAISIKNHLEEFTVKQNSQTGIERRLNEMEMGEKDSMHIPFENKFISDKTNDGFGIILNELHLESILKCKTIKSLIDNGKLSQVQIKTTLKTSIEKGYNDDEFIEVLAQYNSEFINELNQDDLKRAYLKPRSQEDTSKAIFRLVSLGIIDSYTIDYQNKLFKIDFKKKQNGFYYKRLSAILTRYSSSQIAEQTISNLKSEREIEFNEGLATEISICIEFLTDFIYDRIADKRKRAIDDMLGLCQRAIAIENDPIKQNLQVKEEIYYYFNAKYSRYNNVAIIKKGESQVEEPASLLEDHEKQLDSKVILWKYIELVKSDETGSFIDNIKHLRGACMRMIRAYDDPIYIILKAYTLFILAEKTNDLLEEATSEMISGFSKRIHASDQSAKVQDEMNEIIEKLLTIVSNPDIINALHEMKNAVNLIYYSVWTKKFRTRITKNMNYDQ
ncbi:MAG: ATP-dependent DNA helicase RecQ [Flavobacteriales bacterium]|nr:ATP-dependent DNA helicase RecQ [Flavobacteriales bacterium]